MSGPNGERGGDRGKEGAIRPDSSPSSREKILDTAEALFARHGFAGVGLREVAQRVGLGKSSLFHHFATKRELYVAVLERILLAIDANLESADKPADSALESLRCWVAVIVDTLAEHRGFAPLLLRTLFEEGVVGVEQQAHLDEILKRVLGRVERLLRIGIASGQIRDVSVAHTLQTLIGMTVYHFASGEFGDDLVGQPIHSAAEVRRRKTHILSFLERALAPSPSEEMEHEADQ